MCFRSLLVGANLCTLPLISSKEMSELWLKLVGFWQQQQQQLIPRNYTIRFLQYLARPLDSSELNKGCFTQFAWGLYKNATFFFVWPWQDSHKSSLYSVRRSAFKFPKQTKATKSQALQDTCAKLKRRKREKLIRSMKQMILQMLHLLYNTDKHYAISEQSTIKTPHQWIML